MKKLVTLLACLSAYGLSYGKSVDVTTAQRAGYSYLAAKTQVKGVSDMQLAYTSTSTLNGIVVNDFYIFNVVSSNGFVIISADDRVTPVLAYSNTSVFGTTNIPTNISGWLQNYKDQINYVITQDVQATAEITNKWGALAAQGSNNRSAAKTTLDTYVGPLMQTTWDQAGSGQVATYNALCPYDSTYNQLTVTGCVATATAQVMKYWNWPHKGTGSYSYEDDPYGVLSANFDTTYYQWSAMPNSIAGANLAIATLMYQVGVSVNMSYGTAVTDGSGAQVLSDETYPGSPNCTEYALKTYFGYKSTLHGEERYNYPNESDWINLIETEISAGRPVLYVGFGSLGGHNWVADGYDVTDNFMHFNWGWSGASNGYYSVDNLAPPALGVGAGSGNFDDGQAVLIGIEPDTIAVDTALAMYSTIHASQNSIVTDTVTQGQPISITAKVRDAGTVNFYGALDMSLYNVSDTSLAFPIAQLPNRYLLSYGSNTFTFTDSSFNATPGTYLMMLKYEVTGQPNFSKVSQVTNYPNPVLLTVKSPYPASIPQTNSNNTVTIYPNPASDVLYIDTHNLNSSITSIKIIDMQGREMKTINNASSQIVTVPVNTLAAGLYFVELQTGNGIVTKKVSIVR